jgi:copper(I)-binding protein
MSPVRRFGRLAGVAAAALVVAGLAAGCSSGGGSAAVSVTEPWARASSAMAAAGAAYMNIENTGSETDALLGAASPVAETVEVHETVAMEEPAATDAMGGMETPAATDGMGGGMMGMQPIARLEIPAGGSVALEPGGYHIMLIGLKQELKAGETIEITLTFEKAGEVKVTAEVRES